ncbi:patatin-domain-containing protein [Westerdykella ornata]|uniref:Patatin-like phospholipase domain-containing protein n=1 Tax=Westerdykella ornata TaxID=318751 RepID=A0A6A6JHL3_WESOR|nr:patatin-domain-containing protein [Westerdykella ornata]KAF2275902.1 patatin-domain-containing protein [Westerdykella ornata]
MADVNKATDGRAPYSPAAFDYTLLPDYNNDFINVDDFEEFERALFAPENSPSTEDLTQPQPVQRTFITALNDWRPIYQRVRPRNKTKKPPRRGKDETREGVVYIILKWPLLILVFGWLFFLSIAYALTRIYILLYEQLVTWRGRRQNLRARLQQATSYEEWMTSAKELDTFLGNESWKRTDEYAYYDSKTIRRARDQMAKLRKKAEAVEAAGNKTREGAVQETVEELKGLVEICVKNNFAGFENPRLYSETYYGTKNLVQSFVDEVETSVSFLLKTTQLDADSKRAMLKHISKQYGRTALCLSGGATFAYYHFGVAKALIDANLLPDVIAGTSGGALVAALLCTRTDEELKRLLVPALAHRITACHDDTLTWFKRWYRTGARFDSIDWAKRCAWFTRGSMTFREAYERTGRILNVSCVPSDPHSPTILANYLTSPDCVIWSAVLASAAVPGILNPVVLMKKNKNGTLSPYSFGHKWKDGSLRTDIPLKSLNLHFNVRFSIVSQVNPHINLFFFSSRGSVGRPVTHRRGRGWRGGFLGSAIEQYIKLDMNKWLKVLRHLELLPRFMNQDWSEIWLQRFSGTITIWPKSVGSDFYYILSDPSPQRLARMIHVGQLSAFPKLKFIANRAKLERLIQQGRRQFRIMSRQDTGLPDILSEDDVAGLLRQKMDGGAQAYSSDSSDSETYKQQRPRPVATQKLSRSVTVPGSPSLSKRLSGWFSSLSPRESSSRSRDRSPLLNPRSSHDHRPTSMYEFPAVHDEEGPSVAAQPLGHRHKRSGSFLEELRRQSRVFVDDEIEAEDFPAGVKHEGGYGGGGSEGGSGGGSTGRRVRGQDATAGAEALGEGFGDDEREREGEGNGAVGLGLEPTVVG